jgi:hypothetical protein
MLQNVNECVFFIAAFIVLSPYNPQKIDSEDLEKPKKRVKTPQKYIKKRLLQGVNQNPHEYNYTIITGSYPQIHHRLTLPAANGWINCTKYRDANGGSL